MVAGVPFANAEKIKPAVLKVVLQLFVTVQLPPSGQHLLGLEAGVCSPAKLTATVLPFAAAELLSVVVAIPLAPKVTVVLPSTPALAARLAVIPFIAMDALVHGLLASAQAVTVTGVARQLRLLLGSDSS